MKKYIFLLCVVLSHATQCSLTKKKLTEQLTKKNLLDLPMELIDLIISDSMKEIAKIMILSKKHYKCVYQYLLYKQNILLLNQTPTQKNKRLISRNNLLLLEYIKRENTKVLNQKTILQAWVHGNLKYLLTEKDNKICYVPKNTEKELYLAYIPNKFLSTMQKN